MAFFNLAHACIKWSKQKRPGVSRKTGDESLNYLQDAKIKKE